MDVTDVLRDRMQEPAGLQRMIVASVGAHVLLTAAIFLSPCAWTVLHHMKFGRFQPVFQHLRRRGRMRVQQANARRNVPRGPRA